MSDPHIINRLIGRFTDLHEEWESEPEEFDWKQLEGLAVEGAQAYNEGAGPSFHALALDGTRHNAFHERFLAASLQAGFDPFKLTQAGSGAHTLPVIDHYSLAEEAQRNPSSARMHATLMEMAKIRFTPWTEDAVPEEVMQVIEACAESIPSDLLQQLAPDMERTPRQSTGKRGGDPLEGYLSPAEVIADRHGTYG